MIFWGGVLSPRPASSLCNLIHDKTPQHIPNDVHLSSPSSLFARPVSAMIPSVVVIPIPIPAPVPPPPIPSIPASVSVPVPPVIIPITIPTPVSVSVPVSVPVPPVVATPILILSLVLLVLCPVSPNVGRRGAQRGRGHLGALHACPVAGLLALGERGHAAGLDRGLGGLLPVRGELLDGCEAFLCDGLCGGGFGPG